MTLPFTVEQFLGVFSDYNATVWPMQAVLIAAALMAVVIAFRPLGVASRIPGFVLASLWAWSGIAYHLFFFRTINAAAIVFGALFLIQAGVLAHATARGNLDLRFSKTPRGWAGAAIIVYALLAYPLIGTVLGHGYPATPTFGVPCPVTIFTLGMILWTTRPPRWTTVAIPLAWSAIGSIAAWQLGILEDLGMLAAAIVAAVLLATRVRPRLHGAT